MRCPWSHHSTCEHVGNRCTVLPKKWFHDVVCCSLKGGRWARQISDRKFTGRASRSTIPFCPLRAAMRVMKMKPTIRMSRHGPSGPLYARWDGGLMI
eukprot:scaffold26003_cov161-Skeletonema_marinoi.AAC.1